jgi:uncharacterized metal-binding protein
MSSGRVHAAASLVLAVPCGIAVGYVTGDAGAGFLAAIGCACGVILTPDLDTAERKTIEAERIAERAGWPGKLWEGYWWIYAKALHHRSAISHFPFIGTAIRLLYLAIPLLILALWQGWPLVPPMALWPWAAGLAVSDCLHWIMDGLPC